MNFDKFGIGRGKPMLAIDAKWVERDDEHPDAEAVADRIRQLLDDETQKDKPGNPPE
jgi:hypothetical protein